MVAIHVLDLFSYTYHTVYFSPNQLNDLQNFWDRFRDGTYRIILFFTFLAEFGYQKIYVKKGIWAFLALSFFFGALFSGLFYFTNVFLSDKPFSLSFNVIWLGLYSNSPLQLTHERTKNISVTNFAGFIVLKIDILSFPTPFVSVRPVGRLHRQVAYPSPYQYITDIMFIISHTQ